MRIGLGIYQQSCQIDVGSFLPRGIADLDLWLRGDQATIGGGVVTTMLDQSGLGHDCTPVAATVTQTTPADGNGQTAFRFTGVELYHSANVDWTGQTECTIFLVCKKTTTGTFGDSVSKGVVTVNSGFVIEFMSTERMAVYGQAGVNFNGSAPEAGSYPNNKVPYLISATIDATQPQATEDAIWVQGYSQPVTNLGSSNLANIGANDPYFIGARGNSSVFWVGDLYEVIVYKRKLSTVERRAVELYLARRYAIPTDQYLKHNTFGLVGFWDPHLGLTTVDAAVVDPTDFSTANWTPTGLSSRTAHTLTEDNSVGSHVVTEASTTINAQPNKPYHVRAEIPASSGNGRYVMVYSGNGGDQVFLDTQLGVVAGVNGAPTNVTYVAGVLDYDCISPAGPNIYFSTWDGVTGGIVWAGNGVRTATCLRIDVTQKNVSVWLSQAGVVGWNVTNAVAATRPTLWATGGWKGGPYLDYQRAAATQLASPATALNQPSTVLQVASSGDVNGTVFDAIVGNDRRRFNGGLPPSIYAGVILAGPGGYVLNTWYKTADVFQGANSRSHRDVVAYVSGNAGASGGTGIQFGDIGGTGDASTMKQSYSSLYNRALSPGEINAEFAWLDSLAA